MKKLEQLEKYVIVPNVGFYGGFRYDGEDIFLCEDSEKEEGYECKVTQRIEGNVLITDLEKTYLWKHEKQVREVSHQEVELEKGQLLVYVQGTGFTIPEYKMCRIEEAVEQYEILKG